MSALSLTGVDYVRTVEHDGEAIVVVAFSHCSVDELARRASGAATVIRNAPERSILSVALLQGAPYTRESMSIFREYVSGNGPYVLAGAAVGLDYFRHALAAVNHLTGRKIQAFDDEESAKSFLVAEKRRLMNEATRESPPAATDHDCIRWVEYDGERILLMDLGNCDAEELRGRIKRAICVIHNEPPRSIIAVNLLHNFPFGRDVHAAVIDCVRSNRPYVIAAAAVGPGYMKSAIPVLNRFTGRNIRAFDDQESAKTWLISEKRRIFGA